MQKRTVTAGYFRRHCVFVPRRLTARCRTLSHLLPLLPLALLPVSWGAIAEETVSPEAWLHEQIRIGENTHRDNLVQESLYRLQKISPNSPQTLAARIHYALSQQDLTTATQLLDELKKRDPDSDTYRMAMLEVELAQPEGRSKLQQARLMVTGGQLVEARAIYDELFADKVPTLDLSIEYWQLVARIPGQRDNALKQLQALYKRYPAASDLGIAIAKLLFDDDKNEQAYAILRQMAKSPFGAGNAAALWWSQLKETTVTDQSVAQINTFLTLFHDLPETIEAEQELLRRKTLLSDPNYRARLRGLALVEKGQGKTAIASLQQALKASPNDAELLIALGQAWSRTGDRAQALRWYEKAKAAENAADFTSKLNSLIQTDTYWLTIERAEKALERKQLAQAEKLFRQAVSLDDTEAQAFLGLGDVALARNATAVAENHYRRALRLDPISTSAVRSLAALYEQQSPEKALAFLQSLPASLKNTMRETLNALQSDSLKAEAEALNDAGQFAQAEAKYRQARELTPNDPWLNYHLANAMRSQGKNDAADALFAAAMQPHQNDPDWVYPYALYLSGSDRVEQALARLQALDANQWDNDIRELAQRLQLQTVLDRAERLRETDGEAQAIAYLQQQPSNPRIDLTLADWAMEREDYAQAQSLYQRVLANDPHNETALLGNIDALIGEGRLDEAAIALNQLPIKPSTDDIGTGRRLANAWLQVGDTARAEAIYALLKPAARQKQAEPSMDNARLLRDIAEFERRTDRPQEALDDLRYAFAAWGVTPKVEMDNEAFTKAMRNDEQDDWLKRGLKADAEALYKQQNTTITLDHDYWGSSGTDGYSNLTAQTTMLHAAFPVKQGVGFLRADSVYMNAGTFSTDSQGSYFEQFGTCREVGCRDDLSQKTYGVSLAAGWDDDVWHADIGTTPMGFEVWDWVGGIGYDSDWHNIGWTLTASRRPISSSLLSFGGTVDPNTGTSWGGARKNGVQLDLSYDRGGAHGVWGNVAYHHITGKNVADNDRAQAMAGYYYKVINENNRQVRVGLNSIYWHYQKDLGDYYLGQGGYYSPQQYISLSVPVLYRERTENWSWELAGSVSISHSSSNGGPRYPLQSLIPNDLPDKYVSSDSSSSTGTGYTLRALIERRLNAHWSIGAGIDLQQAKDYTPSHALVFLRYSLQPWLGDMDLPPQPLTPYADFK